MMSGNVDIAAGRLPRNNSTVEKPMSSTTNTICTIAIIFFISLAHAGTFVEFSGFPLLFRCKPFIIPA
jgi:hypothetical protein